jgi:hypothetical protein
VSDRELVGVRFVAEYSALVYATVSPLGISGLPVEAIFSSYKVIRIQEYRHPRKGKEKKHLTTSVVIEKKVPITKFIQSLPEEVLVFFFCLLI